MYNQSNVKYLKITFYLALPRYKVRFCLEIQELNAMMWKVKFAKDFIS